MDNATTPKGKVIGNVGTLDMRNATEESVAGIRRIGNVGTLIQSPETVHLIVRLNIGNIGSTIEVPADAQFFSGQSTTNFSQIAEPISMVVNGQLIIEPDTRAEDIEKGLKLLVCAGQILCPEPLIGVLQSKTREANGQVLAYDPAAQVHLGKVLLNQHTLAALADGTQLMVLGHLDLPQIVDEALVSAKLSKLQVLGRITCREENLASLTARLDQSLGTPSISSIPLGFEPIKNPITIDNDTLPSLPSRKLYCNGLVTIAADTDAQSLDAALDGLRTTRLLIAPAHLKGVLAPKCNLLETKAIFYEGELWHITDETILLPSRFDYLEGSATLVVRDQLALSADIEPQVLADRLHKVHNFETITCTPEQIAAIQARLGINEGEWVDSTREANKTEREDGIGNAGYLKL